jgi:predicted nucleic acid-binding protein
VITYVDTSTFVKVVIRESGWEKAREIWNRANAVASTLLITVEAHAALAAARRARRLSPMQYERATSDLDDRLDDMTLLEVGHHLVERAAELAVGFGLRGYDAVHLASAELVGADLFTSADATLCDAARRLGFHVANPMDG